MLEILIILICVAINALLAAAEMAFVSVGRPRLRQLARQGDREAQRLLGLRDNPERTLSVIQLGVTLVGALAAAMGGAGASDWIEPYLIREMGWSQGLSQAVAIFLVVLPITFVSVVAGELVPKTLALRNPLKISLASAKWLERFDRLLSPMVNSLEWSTKRIIRAISPRHRQEHPAAASSIETVELDTLSKEQREYVLNLVNIEKRRVRDIYLPWERVITVALNQPADEVAAVMISSGHTRLPVLLYERVVGILNTKEFMALRASGREAWEEIVRPVVQVGAGDSLIKALRTMQDKRSHLSIVFQGDVRLGIVTMEDILEEIIGDVFDEDDDGALKRILSASSALRSIGSRIDRREGQPDHG